MGTNVERSTRTIDCRYSLHTASIMESMVAQIVPSRFDGDDTGQKKYVTNSLGSSQVFRQVNGEYGQ